MKEKENQNLANYNSLRNKDSIFQRNGNLVSITSNNINVNNDFIDTNRNKSKGYYLNLLKKQLRLINLEI